MPAALKMLQAFFIKISNFLRLSFLHKFFLLFLSIIFSDFVTRDTCIFLCTRYNTKYACLLLTVYKIWGILE